MREEQEAEELRRLELARLDRLLAKLNPLIEDGDPRAVATAVRISESRRALLGIDAPKPVDVNAFGSDRVTIVFGWNMPPGVPAPTPALDAEQIGPQNGGQQRLA